MANKNFLQKLWIELTRVRRVEFISSNQEEENERLDFEFKTHPRTKRIFKITMEIFRHELAKTGIIKSDLQFFQDKLEGTKELTNLS